MKTLYITDLDGTLLDSEARLTEKSKKLLSDAIDNGIDFTVATARTFATVMNMFHGIRLKHPLILMNGVMLYDPLRRKIISYRNIEKTAAEKVFDIYRRHKIFPLVYRCVDNMLEIEYYNTDNPYQAKYIGKRNEVDGKRFIYSPEFTFEGKREIIYIVTLDKYERIEPLYRDMIKTDGISCAFYRDNYTDCYFLEIFAENTSKASALAEVKEMVSADKTVAFGDNLNDIDMFRISDEAYAVENACNELKAVSTAVIGSNTEDSVAKFIFERSEKKQ